MQTEESLLRLSGENIIELIQDHRNELVKRLLEDNTLRTYLSTVHLIKDPSKVKIEFIKRALKELQAQPVDLSHYSSIILDIRKKELAVIPSSNDKLFMEDVERTIKNYLL